LVKVLSRQERKKKRKWTMEEQRARRKREARKGEARKGRSGAEA
jgi:hypothetical protein